MLAAEKNAVDVAKLLIASGADVNAKNRNGRTALMWAVEKKNSDLVEALKAAGAR